MKLQENASTEIQNDENDALLHDLFEMPMGPSSPSAASSQGEYERL
jgi:hypothetical protein